MAPFSFQNPPTSYKNQVPRGILSATVRLHVAYVGSDYYPLSWNPLSILGSEQDILLEASKDPPQNPGRGSEPVRPPHSGGLLDASKRLQTLLRRLKTPPRWPLDAPRGLQDTFRWPQDAPRSLQEASKKPRVPCPAWPSGGHAA